MKNYGDYRERVEFQLARYKKGDSYNTTVEWENVLSSWEVMGDEILDIYRQKGYFRSNPIEKELLDLDISGATQQEQAEKAYLFLRDNFTIKSERGFWPDQNLPEVLKSRSGTPEELNLTLMGIFNSLGITCDPVLIGSKGNGRSSLVPFPFLNQFDEILLMATLDGEKHYIDLSDPIAPFGYVDLEKHVSEGLLLQKKSSQLIPLEIKHNSNSVFITEIKLDSANQLVMNSTLRTFHYEGLEILRRSKALEKANEPMEKLFKANGNLALSDVEITDELEEKNYTTTTFKMVVEGIGSDNFIAFNPFKFSSYSTNPFTQEYRIFPIDFEFVSADTYNAKIEIPEGYELDDYPLQERITIPSKGLSFIYSSNVIGNTLNVVSKFEVRQPIIQPEEYADLKFFMESVASKLSAPVIFKKVAKP